MVVNDDDLDKATIAAGQKTNGHFLHSFQDDGGDARQAFYSCDAEDIMPKPLKEEVVGKKRTVLEADLDNGVVNKVMSVKHFRDYAFS